jgi:alkanesulfonate monooxygenase SsuD/methylene tetrahydromethanopterin reductase-like flavin-dependent oxidoreductase (luciferase family)
VRLGLLLSGQHPAGDSAMGAVGQHLEQVELARELGFSSVWASQHFLSHPFLYLQSVPLLARVAAAAEGMTVGTAILLLTLLNPVEVAENAATLDAIAAGRFVLGVGIGYRPVENAAFGVAHRRADLFERKLEIVRRLLAGDRVTATGHGFELEHARLTLVPERPPPIWVAANSEPRCGGRHGSATHGSSTPRAARRARAPDGPIPGRARRIWPARGNIDAGAQGGVRRRHRRAGPGTRTPAAILADHIDRLGADHLVCRLQWPGMPQHQVLSSMQLLAQEVLPALHARDGSD